MFYAKLDANGDLERYPYSFADLKRDNPRTSFGKTIAEDTARSFGCVLVTPTTQPEVPYTKNLERSARNNGGTWEEVWTLVDASSDEITQRTTSRATEVRYERDEKLAACDWTVLTDSPLTTAKKTEWKAYRTELRNITAAEGFPHTMEWPTEPS